MYTKEEREGILWEFHRSGLSAPAACRSLPLFPNKDNLYAWLKLEEAGELWIGNTYLDDSGRDSPASLNSTGDM